MGIDKSLHSIPPIVVIDGTVYEYGKVGPNDLCGYPKPDPPEWLVEHHDYAKWYWMFRSEQEMLDFIDGLPESAHPPFEPNYEPFRGPRGAYSNRRVIDREGFDREFKRYQQEVAAWRRQLAEKNRQEKAALPPVSPEEAYVTNCRTAINAILDKHLRPYENWDNPEITKQIDLVLWHELKKYREAVGQETETDTTDAQ